MSSQKASSDENAYNAVRRNPSQQMVIEDEGETMSTKRKKKGSANQGRVSTNSSQESTQNGTRDARTCNRYAHGIESEEDLRLLPRPPLVASSPATSPNTNSLASFTGSTCSAGEELGAVKIFVNRECDKKKPKRRRHPSSTSNDSNHIRTAMSPNPYNNITGKQRSALSNSSLSSFGSIVKSNSKISVNGETELDVAKLPDPFAYSPKTPPRFYDTYAPPTVTLNKYAHGSRSLQDIRKLGNDFPAKRYIEPGTVPSNHDFERLGKYERIPTSKKKFMTEEELQEIRALPYCFEKARNYGPIVTPTEPCTSTVNKTLFTEDEAHDINRLPSICPVSNNSLPFYEPPQPTQTINKRLLRKDSVSDLSELPGFVQEINSIRIREYSADSLEDLRLMPSISQISISHTAISFTSDNRSRRQSWSSQSLADLEEIPSISQISLPNHPGHDERSTAKQQSPNSRMRYMMKLAIVLVACGILAACGFAAEQQAAKKTPYDVNVVEFRVGVLEKDGQPDGTNTHTVALFSKYGSVIEASQTLRIYISFKLQDKANGNAVRPHQVFVLFEHSTSGAEVVYVADAAANGGYTLDINLSKSKVDFDGQSGSYKARLVVGDVAIKKPIDWHFADFKLSLTASAPKIVPKSQQIIYDPLPEIKHKFRAPEKRPPAFVSDTFTIVCLAPLGLLLVLWLSIGFNLSNLPLSLWPLLFHSGLCCLFCLYFIFWVRLNMFDTLKYLALVGAFTFIAGNRVLRSLADKRKTKTE